MPSSPETLRLLADACEAFDAYALAPPPDDDKALATLEGPDITAVLYATAGGRRWRAKVGGAFGAGNTPREAILDALDRLYVRAMHARGKAGEPVLPEDFVLGTNRDDVRLVYITGTDTAFIAEVRTEDGSFRNTGVCWTYARAKEMWNDLLADAEAQDAQEEA